MPVMAGRQATEDTPLIGTRKAVVAEGNCVNGVHEDSDDDSMSKSLDNSSYSSILRLALPAALMCATGQLASTVDTALYGRLGSRSLAAFAIVNSTISLITTAFNFLNSVVTAQVSKCVAQKLWTELRHRVLIALGSAILLGVLCSSLLLALQRPVLSLMKADSGTMSLVLPYFHVMLLVLPFNMLQSTCKGILSGFHRLNFAVVGLVLTAVLDVLGNCLVVFYLDMGLVAAGCATLLATFIGALLMLGFVLCLMPRGDMAGHQELEGDVCDNNELEEIPAESNLCATTIEFFVSSKDMMIRSILLQATLFLVTAAASRLDHQSLAATQIGFQLWMLSSYVVDGLETAGNMLVSRLIGLATINPQQNAQLIMLCDRLALLGTAAGICFGAIFLCLKTPLLALFTSDTEILLRFNQFWWVVVCMQPFNALVFTYDGVLYATQSFEFVRNMLAIGFFFFFCPLLTLGSLGLHSLRVLWVAKAVLNLWRFSFAVVRVRLFQKEWKTGALSNNVI